MNEPRPLRPALSDAEIERRLAKCFDILYQAGLRAQARQAAEQRPQLHVVPPSDPASPEQPQVSAVTPGGEPKDPSHGDVT